MYWNAGHLWCVLKSADFCGSLSWVYSGLIFNRQTSMLIMQAAGFLIIFLTQYRASGLHTKINAHMRLAITPPPTGV